MIGRRKPVSIIGQPSIVSGVSPHHFLAFLPQLLINSAKTLSRSNTPLSSLSYHPSQPPAPVPVPAPVFEQVSVLM